MKKKAKVAKSTPQPVEEVNKSEVKDEAQALKVAPLTLNLAGQLGQENLAIVVDKLNEVIANL